MRALIRAAQAVLSSAESAIGVISRPGSAPRPLTHRDGHRQPGMLV
jgi:hypothetical protein